MTNDQAYKCIIVIRLSLSSWAKFIMGRRTTAEQCLLGQRPVIISSLLQYSRFLTSFLCLHPSLSSAARLSATKPPSFTKSCSIWMLLLPHWFTFHSVFNNFMQNCQVSSFQPDSPVLNQTVWFWGDLSRRKFQLEPDSYTDISIFTQIQTLNFWLLRGAWKQVEYPVFLNVQTWQPYPSMFPVPNRVSYLPVFVYSTENFLISNFFQAS